MNKDNFFKRGEFFSLILSSITLGFIFSFREWGYGVNFDFSIGIINLLKTSVIAMLLLLIYQLASKLVALRNGAYTKYKIWYFKRYWFKEKHKFKTPIKVGLFIPLILAVFTNGIVKFAATGCSEINEISHRRLGKKYKHLTEYQIALISLAGPMTLILIATMLSHLEIFSKLVLMGYSIAIFSMIPLSKLDGAKVFFGSAPLYIFSIIFMLSTIFLINLSSPIITLLLALTAAITVFLIFLYKHG